MYYAPRGAVEGEKLVLTGPEARHIARVLRHRPGDLIHAADGRGVEYEVELSEVKAGRVVGEVRHRLVRPREPRCRVDLAQGLIKGDGMADVVDGATQLGVECILPLVTARTVAGLGESRLGRLRNVAVRAMKSSTRSVVPEVLPPIRLEGLLKLVPGYALTVVAYEDESGATLADVLEPDVRSVLLVVGSEGGFLPEEVALMSEAGARSFSMGPRRLRAETAGVVATALVLDRLGDLEVQSK